MAEHELGWPPDNDFPDLLASSEDGSEFEDNYADIDEVQARIYIYSL